jgi:hypothetical protein
MGLLRVPLSSDWPCCGCGYPVRGLARSGDCPECGLRVTASIVRACEDERDAALARQALRVEWKRTRGTLALGGVAAVVLAATLAAEASDPSGVTAALKGLVLGCAFSATATTFTLGVMARYGFLTIASYLSLVPVAFTASLSAIAVVAFLVHVGLWIVAPLVAALVLLYVLRREVAVHGFGTLLILMVNSIAFTLAACVA